MTPAAKRPYVSPRIGHSILRPFWYVAAVAGVLAVALILPRTPSTLPALDGSWVFRSTSGVADLPAGSVRLLVSGDHYALIYEAAAGTGGSGFEMGDLLAADGGVVMLPRRGSYGGAAGGWSVQLPDPRHLGVRREGDRLLLTDGDGRALEGLPAAP